MRASAPGEDVELAPRPVTVHRLEVLPARRGLRQPLWSTSTSPSSAPRAPTSAPSPATPAAALGGAGHLTALRRTRVGPFTSRRGRRPARAGPRRDAAPAFVPVAAVAARCFPVLRLDAAQEADVRVGRRLPEVALHRAHGPDGARRDVPRCWTGPSADGARPEAVFVG